jgi:hypothetical protein
MWTGVGIWLSVTWSEDRWSTKNKNKIDKPPPDERGEREKPVRGFLIKRRVLYEDSMSFAIFAFVSFS